jgi:hypothetical protein
MVSMYIAFVLCTASAVEMCSYQNNCLMNNASVFSAVFNLKSASPRKRFSLVEALLIDLCNYFRT